MWKREVPGVGKLDDTSARWAAFFGAGRAWACLAVGLPLLLGGFGALRALAAPGPARQGDLASCFAGMPDTSLARRMSLASPEEDPAAGLTLARHWRWWPELKAAVLESRLQGTAPRPAGEVPLLSFTVRMRDAADDAPYSRLAYRSEEWYGSSFWSGPDWTRVGKDWHHPGENTPSARCFRAPHDGRLTITGRACKLHLDGDGVRLAIRHGLKSIWAAEIEGKDSQGVEPHLVLDVKEGDRIRFIVHKRGTITCDTTGWDPVITYEGGEAFRASTAFPAYAQGAGHWSYEMELRDPEEAEFGPLDAYSGKEAWYGSPFWSGPDWTRVGKDWQHPGENTPSVRSFRAPRDGQVTLRGRVRKLHLEGDGIRASILRNNEELWKTELDGADGNGVEPDLHFEVRKGDAIRFVIHKRGGISCDTTGWDPVVTYADGESFRASAAFGPKQGSGWFYELRRRDDPTPDPPLLRAIDPRMAVREWPIASAPVTVTHQESAGAVLLSDDAGQSHLALAVGTSGPWKLHVRPAGDGCLRVSLSASAGGSGALPAVAIAPCEGPWTAAIGFVRRLADAGAVRQGCNEGPPSNPPARGGKAPSPRAGRAGVGAVPIPPDLAALGRRLREAHRAATAGPGKAPEIDLFLMAQAEWRRDDCIAETPASYSAAVAEHLTRARRLATDLRSSGASLAADKAELARLNDASRRKDLGVDAWRSLYVRTRLLKRRLALSNPLLDFRQLLFCKRMPTGYSHLVGQYFGWRQRPGGGLFVLSDPGYTLDARGILKAQLPPGSFLEPRPSYDGKRVLFSYVACAATNPDPMRLPVNEEGGDEGYFHLYEARIDGTGLRQLTFGRYDDFMPEYLPNGDIVFVSTRRKGYSRCFGHQFSQRWHSYTLHRVRPDGSGLRCLSFNDVSEWFPSVSNTGQILFARWDYIDRDAVTHQNLWAMRPDGTNVIAVWGNATPKPHCTFQAKPVPGSDKIAFVASAHHSVTAGPVCLLDPRTDANGQAPITRLTPGPYPEAEGSHIGEYYESVWPLSERHFLVSYSPMPLRWEGQALQPDNALGLYLLDAAGNRELIYRDPAIGSTTPIPVRARKKPPVLPDVPPAAADDTGEMVVTDIYQGLKGVARGTVKAMRVVQIFPKSTYVANDPPIGMAREENARAILGTVPVEPDGSARFTLPARRSVLFQALDARGFAVQTMRSLVSVQPGEHTSCIGCHEPQHTSVPNAPAMALRRPASVLDPGDLGGRPFSYVDVVQPVLDRRCVQCHGGSVPAGALDLTGAPRDSYTRSYWALCGSPDDLSGGKVNPQAAAAALVPRFGMRNQVQVTPVGGVYGALGSRLMRLLLAGHHGVTLDDAEVRRLAAWIDLNAIFYGVYEPKEQARQLAGERVPMPALQ